MQFSSDEKQVIKETLTLRLNWLLQNAKSLSENKKTSAQKVAAQIKGVLNKLDGEASPSPPLSARDVRILIIDDDDFCAKLLAAQLEQIGFSNVDLAGDGQEAINLMYDTPLPYQLILSDWNMPVKSGLEVHSAMVASERYENSRFVMTTSVTKASQIREAIDHGIHDYLAKPIEEESLKKVLSRFFPNVSELQSESA